MKNRNERVITEFQNYYASYDPCTEKMLDRIEEKVWNVPEKYSYLKKARMHELLCEECPVHLFRESDFFFEISSGRERFTWGGLQSPVGSFFHEKTADRWLLPYAKEMEGDLREGYAHCWNNPVGFDHHCPNYDVILEKGLSGIIAEAQERLTELECIEKQPADELHRRQAFYESVIRSNRALIRLQHRFEEEALRLAEEAAAETPNAAGVIAAEKAAERLHYEKIAAAAARVPEFPAETFYEGLCAILFYRECASSIEGLGISTFAQLDRLLGPLYEKDLAAGRITRERAMDLICDLLLYTDGRFDVHNVFRETSTTIEIGGCDRDGNTVYNEVTRMILDAVMQVRSVNTKVNCRISKASPAEYLERIAEVQAANLPTIMMHNDDVIIPGRVRRGQAVEDARLYVGCGCHEVVLSGSEVCTRADTWINLPRLFLNTMERMGDCGDYEELYSAFLADVKAYHERIAAAKNRGEAHWCECDPYPLYSSTFPASLEKGKDVTEGGAKYNTTSLSMLGTATVIDSIFSVKRLVFEEKKVNLPELVRILSENYAGREELRQYIINQIPKHGTNSEELNRFSADVLADLAKMSGQTNARGGEYLPAFYPHDLYRDLGGKTGATPDGRLAGTPLSRGVSPSEFVETDSPLDLVNSLKPIDFTDYAESFCAELTLPQMPDPEKAKAVLTAILKAFLEVEGSSLQFNLVDRETLVEAQKKPEQFRNLCVRVCGYSAVFVTLDEKIQQDLIERAVR